VRRTEAAFEGLFRSTRDSLLAYYTRRIDAADAADLLAETYLIAWQRWDDLPSGDERRLWLYGVGRRLLAQHRRELARSNEAVAQFSTTVPPTTPQHREHKVVRDVLAELPEMDRDLLTLTSWERLTTAEAARVIGITPGSARVRLHRIRKRLERDERLRDLLRLADSQLSDRAGTLSLDPVSALR
jgi:RNA polymerase sigma-70 factor (ECF subfamily)